MPEIEIPLHSHAKRKGDVTIALSPEMINGMILDGDKLMYHKDRIDAWMRGERIAPITIDMALTRACNMRCTFCYAMLQENVLETFEGDKKKMGVKTIDRFLDDAAEVGVKGISLISDGESTVHPYVYEKMSKYD